MSRRKKDKKRAPAQPSPPEEAQPPRDWQWWILAAAIPLILCASKLDLDFWYDEAYTLDVFVSQPWSGIATDYSAPNNHVFYSLLLRPFYLVSQSEYLLRFPSLLFAAGTLAMVFRIARRWSGLSAALLATLFLGLTQMFLIHAIQVRGYGLSMFLAAWLAEMALAERTDRWWRLGAIALAGAAFLYVLPTNLLFLVPLALVAAVWTAFRDGKPSATLKELAVWGLACLLAGLAYLPIIDQVRAAGSGGASASPGDVLLLAGQVFWAATRDWLPVLPLAALGLLFWTREARRRPSRTHLVLPLLTAGMLAGPFLLSALLRVHPFVRNYCPVLPFLALGIGWLVAESIKAGGRFLLLLRSEYAAGLLGMMLLACVAVPRIWTYPARLAEHRRHQFAQDGYYNYYAAEFHPSQVASYLRDSIGPEENYVILFADADHFPLGHYFRRAGVPLRRIDRGARAAPLIVYLVTPALPDYEALAAKSGLSAELLRRFPLVKDFGYYRLYESRSRSPSSDWGVGPAGSPLPAVGDRGGPFGPSKP